MIRDNKFSFLFNISYEKDRMILKILGFTFRLKTIPKNSYMYKILDRRYISRMLMYKIFNDFPTHHNFINYLLCYKDGIREFLIKFITEVELIRHAYNKKISIPVMDFNITNKCTLRCEQCGSMMPFYSKEDHYTTTFDEFKKDLDRLLSGCNKIYCLKLIGGEPLLVEDIDKMFEYAASKKQIKNIDFVTNGTIVPSDRLLKLCKKHRNKVFFCISDYSSNKDLKNLKYKEVKQKLDEYKVKWYFPSQSWCERGEIYKRNRTIDEIRYTFSKCWQKDCVAMMEGKFHHCTRSIAIQRLSDFEPSEDEYIDIRKENETSLAQKLRLFYTKDYFSACDFCIHSYKTVPRAIQTKETLRIGEGALNE